MRLRRYLLAGLIILAIIVVVYTSFDKIVIFTLSKSYRIDISYKSLVKDPDIGYTFENLKILNKKMGIGFFSQSATIKPAWGTDWFKSALLDFKFRDVHFLKNGANENRTTYDTVLQLTTMPFEGRWMYKDVSGLVEIFSNGITIKRLSANGREMKLILTGDLYYNNIVDMDTTIHFSQEVLKEIPPELYSVIMQDEPNEWKSFSVKIKGNLSSPSIQITGKIFRLNFGTVKMKD